MKLGQLYQAVQALVPNSVSQTLPETVSNLDISGLCYRAQSVRPGSLFVAVKGFAADGHDYIQQAVSRGAVAVVCQRPVTTAAATIVVSDSRRALAELSAAFFGHPSRAMTLVGITGTNGKTTTSYLIESILKTNGHTTGVIGTINYRYADQTFDNPVTTPESLDLQQILADMHCAGTTHVVMEASSHGLALQRVRGCDIDVAVFTNLSQDHLDFHQDMDSYWASKRLLFTDYLSANQSSIALRAVINSDDPMGKALSGELKLPHCTTGQSNSADVQVLQVDFGLTGISAKIRTPKGNLTIRSPLTGRHNLENILNAVGVAVALGIEPATVQAGIASLQNVPGRLERVIDDLQQRFVYVDYAHTPDALKNVLQALRDLTGGRIVCVFGCGGDRDRAKRPLMGAIAGQLSDLVIITSDNPRSEPAQQIIEQIVKGVRQNLNRHYTPMALKEGYDDRGYVIEPDRRKAIFLSIHSARPGDTILIAGKGHEPYQLIGDQKLAFDDRIVAREALKMLSDGGRSGELSDRRINRSTGH